jgi:hypothetical protein
MGPDLAASSGRPTIAGDPQTIGLIGLFIGLFTCGMHPQTVSSRPARGRPSGPTHRSGGRQDLSGPAANIAAAILGCDSRARRAALPPGPCGCWRRRPGSIPVLGVSATRFASARTVRRRPPVAGLSHQIGPSLSTSTPVPLPVPTAGTAPPGTGPARLGGGAGIEIVGPLWHAGPAQALQRGAGYGRTNDVSEHRHPMELQGPWTSGKRCPSRSPLGPLAGVAAELGEVQDVDLCHEPPLCWSPGDRVRPGGRAPTSSARPRWRVARADDQAGSGSGTLPATSAPLCRACWCAHFTANRRTSLSRRASSEPWWVRR